MRQWKAEPRNLVVLTGAGPTYPNPRESDAYCTTDSTYGEDVLKGYNHIKMSVLYRPCDPRLSIKSAASLMHQIQPLHVIVPHEYIEVYHKHNSWQILSSIHGLDGNPSRAQVRSN